MAILQKLSPGEQQNAQTYKDVTIELLADQLVAMEARAENAEHDRDAYRLLACQALGQLHAAQRRNQQLRGRVRQLTSALRGARPQVMTRVAA